MKKPAPPSPTAEIETPAGGCAPDAGSARKGPCPVFRGFRLALILFCFGGAEELPADTILLKNGSRIENVETWEDGSLVNCSRFGSVIGYPREEIQAVLAGPVKPAPPEARPPVVFSADDGAPGATAPLADPLSPGFRMNHLFDGDSFKASDGNLTVHIRIAGIDAPERGSGKKGVPGQPYSSAAADHLRGLISNRPIQIKGYGMDSYNRQLAEVFADGRNVGLNMVEAGYAEVYSGRLPEGFDLKPYVDAEARARKYGQGMWAQGRMYVSPRKWRAGHPR